VCVYMYVCMYVSMYLCIYVSMQIYVYMYMYSLEPEEGVPIKGA
jgi:hypothetical protein